MKRMFKTILALLAVLMGAYFGCQAAEWAVDKTGAIVVKDAGAKAWAKVGGAMEEVVAGESGSVWAINKKNEVFIRDGISKAEPHGKKWAKIEGAPLKQITADNDGKLWGVGVDGAVYVREGITEELPAGTAWNKIDGDVIMIAVGGVSSKDDGKASSDTSASKAVLAHKKEEGPKGDILEYNKVVTITSVAYPDRKVWTSAASRHSNNASQFPHRHAELLVGPAGDDRIMDKGAGFFVLQAVSDAKKAGAIKYHDEIRICSPIGAPGEPSVAGTYDPMRVWVAHEDNRYVGRQGGERKDDFGEIVVMVQAHPEAANPQYSSFTIVNADDPNKKGKIGQLDNVYIISKDNWKYSRPETLQFIVDALGADRDAFYQGGRDKRLWVAPESRYDRRFYEIVIGDGHGMGTQGADRSLEFGKFKIEEIKEKNLPEGAKAVFNKVKPAVVDTKEEVEHQDSTSAQHKTKKEHKKDASKIEKNKDGEKVKKTSAKKADVKKKKKNVKPKVEGPAKLPTKDAKNVKSKSESRAKKAEKVGKDSAAEKKKDGARGPKSGKKKGGRAASGLKIRKDKRNTAGTRIIDEDYDEEIGIDD